MNTNSKVILDVDRVQKQLLSDYDNTLNKARAKVLAFLILALCKVQDVGLFKLANSFNSKAKSLSSMRRVQRFLSEVSLDFDKLAKFIFKLLPFDGPYVLSMDRTNWQFGSLDINALFVGICYNGIAFPLLFKLLPKRGNSNTRERIEIMNRYLKLFGENSINCLVADREFVGHDWLQYLNNMHIPYHIRIKENFEVTRHGKTTKAWTIFADLKMRQSVILDKIYSVNGEYCYLSASRIKNKEGKPELQIIVSYNQPQKSLERYRLRWQIETCFKGMKSSGFNIENTHLKDLDRIGNLFGVLMIAFVWAYVVGIHQHEHVIPIRLLKTGRLAKSFVKYGIELISNYLSNIYSTPQFDLIKKLSCT